MSMTSAPEILETLINFDTTSSRPNRELIEYVHQFLSRHGVASQILPGKDSTKANLLASLGPGDTAGVMLAGHTDVVPTAGQDWTSDPFRLSKRDGKFFGRGSCDMKGFIAASLSVLSRLSARNVSRRVYLALTHDEETTMEGAQTLARHLRDEKIAPEWVWIGEPTDLHLIDSHKGTAYFETVITGVPGHSSKPDLGLNAVDLGCEFVSILQENAAQARAAPRAGSRFDPPYTTFNSGIIEGGTAENIIAEHCRIVWQVRPHPGDDLDTLVTEIERKAQSKMKSRFLPFEPRAGIKTRVCSNIPALVPSKGNPGESLLRRLTGHAKTEAVSFGTEGGIYQSLGLPVIICGPGSIDQAHKADEFVRVDHLARFERLLEHALQETNLPS